MPTPSQQANIRRAWLAERIGDGTSDASLVALGSATFRVSEKTIAKDLAFVYDRWIKINEANTHAHLAKFMELGLTILEETRNAGRKTLHFGPAVAQFKNIAIMAGVYREAFGGKQEPASQGDTRPDDNAIRERIASLQKDQKVRERAMKAGLDLDAKD